MTETDTAHKAYEQGLALLVRREHSCLELKRKLLSRGYQGDTIENAIARLKEQDYLSDERFAENYVRHRADRGYGPNRIALELRERGVDDGLADRAIRDAEINWDALMQSVKEKKFGELSAEDFTDMAKQKRFLHYRGFDV